MKIKKYKQAMLLCFFPLIYGFIGCTPVKNDQPKTIIEEKKIPPINEETQKLIDVIENQSSTYDDGRYMVEYINEGADPNARFPYTIGDWVQGELNFKEFTPLSIATYYKNPKKIKVLIENKADVNAQIDQTGDTPLTILIAESGDKEKEVTESVRLLLEAGADPNITRYRQGVSFGADGISPLHLAVAWEYEEVVKQLLEAGADPNYTSSDHGRSENAYGVTPLSLAAGINDPTIFKTLIEYGANVNLPVSGNGKSKYAYGAYPIHDSVSQGAKEQTLMLINAGVNVNVHLSNKYKINSSCNGSTPLGVSGEYPSIVKILLENGADHSIPRSDDSNVTPIMTYSYDGHYESIQILLDNGADINNVSIFGTALDGAIETGQTEVIKLLRENGAKTAEELGISLEENS